MSLQASCQRKSTKLFTFILKLQKNKLSNTRLTRLKVSIILISFSQSWVMIGCGIENSKGCQVWVSGGCQNFEQYRPDSPHPPLYTLRISFFSFSHTILMLALTLTHTWAHSLSVALFVLQTSHCFQIGHPSLPHLAQPLY